DIWRKDYEDLADGFFAASTGEYNVVVGAASSESKPAAIILNAQSGTLTLQTGTLNADGPSGYGAGHILLLADTITTVSGTVISASQTAAASATYHYVMLAANTIEVAGSGLEVRANGNGVTSASAQAALLPKGSMAVTSSDDFARTMRA